MFISMFSYKIYGVLTSFQIFIVYTYTEIKRILNAYGYSKWKSAVYTLNKIGLKIEACGKPQEVQQRLIDSLGGFLHRYTDLDKN